MFVLLVDKRELRALVGGEMVDSLLAGPWKVWVIFCLGLNVDVAGVMAGEGAFVGVERVNGGCGGIGRREEDLHTRCGTNTALRKAYVVNITTCEHHISEDHTCGDLVWCLSPQVVVNITTTCGDVHHNLW